MAGVRRGLHFEITPPAVGADEELVLAMVDVIPMRLLARQEHGEWILWTIGSHIMALARVLRFDAEHDHSAVARFLYADVVKLVVLVVDLVVCGVAQHVPPELVRAFGGCVLGGI